MGLALKKEVLSKMTELHPSAGRGHQIEAIWSDGGSCMTWLWHSCMSECLCDERPTPEDEIET